MKEVCCRSEQQPIEFIELAALALPAHEAAFMRVPETGPVVEIEAGFAYRRLRIALIERGDLALGFFENQRVDGAARRRGVGPVGEQRKARVGVHVGERMHLEQTRAAGGVTRLREQHGHDHQRPRVR